MRRFELFLFFIAVAGLFNPALYAEKVEGRVKDINEKVLSGVTVSLIKGERVIDVVETDKKGNFEIQDQGVLHSGCHLILRSSKFYIMKIALKKRKHFYRVILIPKEHMKEEITVTAYNSRKNSTETPMAEAVISRLELKERMPETVVEALSETPGVDFLGKGGHSITPSIRGLARRRVLVLLNGSRMTSDRRVGTSASLIPPGLVRRVEIARASSSVIYGSDAMGGVVNLFTGYSFGSDPPLLKLYLNGHSADSGAETGVQFFKSFGTTSFQGGYSYARANNYFSPESVIFHSGFIISSGIVTFNSKTKKRDFSVSYFDGSGEDIGKPDRDNDPGNYTYNPLIRDRFLQFNYVEKEISGKGRVTIRGFFNPSKYFLTKVKNGGEKLGKSFTTGENYGGKLFYSGKNGKNFAFSLGVDWYGRRSVKIESRNVENGTTISSFPLTDGKRDDLGFFITMELNPIDHLGITGGARYSALKISALSSGENRSSKNASPVFFIGLKKDIIFRGLSAFFNVGRSFRAPSLSESYYSGITGRKYVKGNPDLTPESSLSFDSGIKYTSDKVFFGAYLFRYSINDLIERFRDSEGIYSYDNIDKGTINGTEFEFQFFPYDKFKLFGHFYYYLGRSTDTGTPLNDVPSPKLYIGSKFFADRFWLEFNYIHSFAKNSPGPAEVLNNQFTLINVKGGIYFSPAFYLHLKVANLLNNFYYANADPDIPPSKGINISAGVTLNIK